MRIALISDWYYPRVGGLELQMRDLATELRDSGHEVTVITVTPGEPEVDGIPVRRLHLSRLPKVKVGWQTRMLERLDHELTIGNFDIVHAHGAFSPLSLASTYVASKKQIPSVLTEHSVLRGMGGKLLGAAERFLSWSKWPDVLTAVSSYVANEIEQVAGRTTLVLPNGVHPDEWTETVPADATNELNVVTVMRLTRRKRPVDFVRAIPQILGRLPPSAKVRFTIVGDGPERARVVREAERLGVTNHLELLGRQPRETVKRVLASASLFVLPTSKEALSIATLEALSSKVPVVAMNHGGIVDIVKHGREGFLANSFDDFVTYIVELLADDGLRQRMALATQAAAARFRWEIVLQRHLEIYELARSRRRLASRTAQIARPQPLAPAAAAAV